MEKLARSTNLPKSTVFRNYVRKGVAAGGTAFPVFSANDRRTEEVIRLVAKTANKIPEALGFIEFSWDGGRREVNEGR
jgi:DNA-binding IclR family transcriptional regulator